MDGLFPILLIPILAGYIFCHAIPILNVKMRGYSGYHLIMIILIVGISMLPVAYYFYMAVYPNLLRVCPDYSCYLHKMLCPILSWLQSVWHFFADPMIEFLSSGVDSEKQSQALLKSSFLTLMFSALLWIFLYFVPKTFLIFSQLLNELLPWSIKLFFKNIFARHIFKVIKNISITIRGYLYQSHLKTKGGVMGRFILDAFENVDPVVVTLKSRKVYIGFISALPTPADVDEKENWNIKLLPLQSGYRSEDKQSLVLDNDYIPFLDVIELFPYMKETEKIKTQSGDEIGYDEAKNLANNFGIVINWRDIETASIWLPELYKSLSS